MISVISDYVLWDSKPSYYMIEQKKGGCVAILYICRDCLNPFCKIINGYNDVTMPLAEVGLQCIKLIPHLEKGPTAMMRCKGAGWVHFFR